MSEVPTDLDRMVQRTLGEDFAVIRSLFPETPNRDLMTVAPGSSLSLDDAATAGFDPMSSQVMTLLHSAADNLHGVRVILQDAGVIHAYAEYAMVRAGIASAVVAWWLLAPGERRERVTRSLRWFW